MPTRVRPCRSISGVAGGEQPPGRARGWSWVWAVASGSVCDRVARVKSSKRSRSTTVRPTRPAARIRRVTRSTRPTSDGVDLVGGRSARGRGRAASRSTGAAGRPAPAGGRGCGPGRGGGGPTARPSIDDERRLAEPGHLAHGRDAAVAQLAGGDRPDAPQPFDRQRVQEGELAVGRHDQQAVGLGHAAGHLGQELRAGHPDGDGQADPLADVAAQPGGDLGRACRRSGAARRRRGRPRRSRAPRPAAWCRRTPRTPPCWPRCRPPSGARPRSPAGRAAGPGAPPIAVRTPKALAS